MLGSASNQAVIYLDSKVNSTWNYAIYLTMWRF